jgi:hypothetical protein
MKNRIKIGVRGQLELVSNRINTLNNIVVAKFFECQLLVGVRGKRRMHVWLQFHKHGIAHLELLLWMTLISPTLHTTFKTLKVLMQQIVQTYQSWIQLDRDGTMTESREDNPKFFSITIKSFKRRVANGRVDASGILEFHYKEPRWPSRWASIDKTWNGSNAWFKCSVWPSDCKW